MLTTDKKDIITFYKKSKDKKIIYVFCDETCRYQIEKLDNKYLFSALEVKTDGRYSYYDFVMGNDTDIKNYIEKQKQEADEEQYYKRFWLLHDIQKSKFKGGG